VSTIIGREVFVDDVKAMSVYYVKPLFPDIPELFPLISGLDKDFLIPSFVDEMTSCPLESLVSGEKNS
jgi:hypothetical protein